MIINTFISIIVKFNFVYKALPRNYAIPLSVIKQLFDLCTIHDDAAAISNQRAVKSALILLFAMTKARATKVTRISVERRFL